MQIEKERRGRGGGEGDGRFQNFVEIDYIYNKNL